MTGNFLDLKYALVCLIAKETIRQAGASATELDFSSIECEISAEIDEILKKMGAKNDR